MRKTRLLYCGCIRIAESPVSTGLELRLLRCGYSICDVWLWTKLSTFVCCPWLAFEAANIPLSIFSLSGYRATWLRHYFSKIIASDRLACTHRCKSISCVVGFVSQDIHVSLLYNIEHQKLEQHCAANCRWRYCFLLIIRRWIKIAFASNRVTYHYRITMGMVTYAAPAVEKS